MVLDTRLNMLFTVFGPSVSVLGRQFFTTDGAFVFFGNLASRRRNRLWRRGLCAVMVMLSREGRR
jgi:hypothetical protein